LVSNITINFWLPIFHDFCVYMNVPEVFCSVDTLLGI